MATKELKQRILAILPKTSLFGGISTEDVEFFSESLKEATLGKGEVLFSEGDPPGDSYLLLEGEVEVCIRGKQVDTFREGSVMGVASPIGIQNQLVMTTAQTDVVMAVIPTKTIYLMAKERPELYGMIMMNVARDLARGLKVMTEVIDGYVRSEKGEEAQDSEGAGQTPN